MRKSKLRWTSLLTVLICLSGCGTAAVYSCPPLKTYPPTFSAALADELEKAGPLTVEAISDYYVLRRQVGACSK